MGMRKGRITSSGSAAIGWGLLWAGVGNKLLGDRDAVAGASGEGLEGGEKEKGGQGRGEGGRVGSAWKRNLECLCGCEWVFIISVQPSKSLPTRVLLLGHPQLILAGRRKGKERVPPPLY